MFLGLAVLVILVIILKGVCPTETPFSTLLDADALPISLHYLFFPFFLQTPFTPWPPQSSFTRHARYFLHFSGSLAEQSHLLK